MSSGIVERGEGLPAVERFRDRQTCDIDRLVVGGIDPHLAEIHRTCVAVADERPRVAFVFRPQNAAALRDEFGRRPPRGRLRRLRAKPATAAAAGDESVCQTAVVAPVEVTAAAGGGLRLTAAGSSSAGCSALRSRRRDFGCRGRLGGRRRHRATDLARFDLRVDDVRVGARDVERNAAVRAGWKPGPAQLRPVFAGVRALPQPAARAAAVEAAAASAPMIAGRINNVAVGRIEHDVGEPGVIVDEFDLVPRFPAIARLVDPSIRTRAE